MSRPSPTTPPPSIPDPTQRDPAEPGTPVEAIASAASRAAEREALLSLARARLEALPLTKLRRITMLLDVTVQRLQRDSKRRRKNVNP